MFRALLLVCILSLPCHGQAENLNRILQLNDAAHGGSEAFERIENIRIRLVITEPGFEVTGTYVATRFGDMRIDIKADEQTVFSEGLHQSQAWQWTPDGGIESQDGTAASALRHGIELPSRFFTLLQARSMGADVSLVGAVKDNSGEQWQIRLELPDGFSRDYFIGQTNYLIVRERDHRAFHPAVDATPVPIETRYSDATFVDGVLRYSQSENCNASNGEWLGSTKVVSVEHNVVLEDGYFEPGH